MKAATVFRPPHRVPEPSRVARGVGPDALRVLPGRALPCVAVLLAATVSVSACRRIPDVSRDEDRLLQTSALRYRLTGGDLGFRVTIPWSFRNGTGAPVYLPACGGDVRPILQMWRKGSWFDAWTPFRGPCPPGVRVVAAGETLADTLAAFGAPAGSNVRPAFAFPDVDGVYRLLWDRALTRYDGERMDPTALLPVDERVSNRFVMTR